MYDVAISRPKLTCYQRCGSGADGNGFDRATIIWWPVTGSTEQ